MQWLVTLDDRSNPLPPIPRLLLPTFAIIGFYLPAVNTSSDCALRSSNLHDWTDHMARVCLMAGGEYGVPMAESLGLGPLSSILTLKSQCSGIIPLPKTSGSCRCRDGALKSGRRSDLWSQQECVESTYIVGRIVSLRNHGSTYSMATESTWAGLAQ